MLVIAAEDFVAAVVELTALLLIQFSSTVEVSVLPLPIGDVAPAMLYWKGQRAGAFDLFLILIFGFAFGCVLYCGPPTYIFSISSVG